MRSSNEAHKRRAALSKVKKAATELTHDYGYASFVIDCFTLYTRRGDLSITFRYFSKKFLGSEGKEDLSLSATKTCIRSVAGRLPLPFKSSWNGKEKI